MDADDVIRTLDLKPHPEGGFYREIYRDRPAGGERGALTSIYFLLKAGKKSAWHRIDATEVWNFHAGAPLALSLSPHGIGVATHCLGLGLAAGERPQIIIPPGCWQSAETLGAWTLVGCLVAPAFEFERFELAPPGWHPAPHGWWGASGS